MDIIENWNLLNSRISRETPEAAVDLVRIHMGAFDDLRKSGHMIKIDGKPVSHMTPIMPAEERLQLAGNIGRSQIDADIDPLNMKFVIQNADYFPNCIFIALAAIIENLDGGINTLIPDSKIPVNCDYETIDGNNDPLGKILPLLERYYPWISLSATEQKKEAPAPPPPRCIPLESSHLLFKVETIAKIDTMRTCFSGTVIRGSIHTGDILNIVDTSGKVLCPEGTVLLMAADMKKIDQVPEKQHVDELLLSAEIPPGSYNGILLAEGDEAFTKSKPSPSGNPPMKEKKKEEKKSFWKKLFGR